MKKLTIVTAVFSALMLTHTTSSAQGFLKKLKDKASDVANRAVDKKVDKAVGIDNTSQNTSSTDESSGSSMSSALQVLPPLPQEAVSPPIR
jgi:hypothetical protein